jgi:hypothetical protein
LSRALEHGAAIGPVVDHGYFGWVRAFAFNEPPLHRVAKGDDLRGFPHEKPVHLVKAAFTVSL